MDKLIQKLREVRAENEEFADADCLDGNGNLNSVFYDGMGKGFYLLAGELLEFMGESH